MVARIVFVAAALCAAVPAAAQDAAPTSNLPSAEDLANRITVGAGVATIPDYEGSNDNRFAVFPAVDGQIGGFAFQVLANRASIDLIPNKPGPGWDIQAGPMAVLNFNRTSIKQIEDPRIKALGKLDTSIEVGGYVGIGKTGVITSDYDKLTLSVSYRTDVSKVSNGATITPNIAYLTPLSTKSLVGLFAQANHVDSDYAQTYFGITPGASVASGLPTFTARSGWKDVTLGGFAGVSLTGDLTGGITLFAGGSWRKLLGDFADSPIVRIAGKSDQWSGAVGLGYTF